MNLPIIQNAVGAVKQWASFGGNDQPVQPLNPVTRKPRLSFDQLYPRVGNPLKLNDNQRVNLMPQLGLISVGKNEVDLALSRTPSDTDFTAVPTFVSGAIRCWRDQAPIGTDSDALAGRKLLESSASLAKIDSRLEEARLATESAQAAEKAFEKAFLEFRAVPGKYRQLVDKVAGLEGERNRLVSTDFEAKIKQLLELEYNPKVGVIIQGSVQELLIQKQTLDLRLAVIDDILSQCRPSLAALADDNKRLAKDLDVPEHKL